MSFFAVAAITAGGAIIGGTLASNAAKKGARMQSDAASYAADLQHDTFLTINEQQAPYREAGYRSLRRLEDLLPQLSSPISRGEIMRQPGYQFAMQQGTDAARRMANVGGGGSNVDRAAQKFAMDYTLSNAMPTALAQRQNIYNTLAGVAGIGQASQGQVSQAGQAMAGNMGQAAIGGASALAAGQIGSANAYGGTIGSIGDAAMMYGLMRDRNSPSGYNGSQGI